MKVKNRLGIKLKEIPTKLETKIPRDIGRKQIEEAKKTLDLLKSWESYPNANVGESFPSNAQKQIEMAKRALRQLKGM